MEGTCEDEPSIAQLPQNDHIMDITESPLKVKSTENQKSPPDSNSSVAKMAAPVKVGDYVACVTLPLKSQSPDTVPNSSTHSAALNDSKGCLRLSQADSGNCVQERQTCEALFPENMTNSAAVSSNNDIAMAMLSLNKLETPPSTSLPDTALAKNVGNTQEHEVCQVGEVSVMPRSDTASDTLPESSCLSAVITVSEKSGNLKGSPIPDSSDAGKKASVTLLGDGVMTEIHPNSSTLKENVGPMRRRHEEICRNGELVKVFDELVREELGASSLMMRSACFADQLEPQDRQVGTPNKSSTNSSSVQNESICQNGLRKAAEESYSSECSIRNGQGLGRKRKSTTSPTYLDVTASKRLHKTSDECEVSVLESTQALAGTKSSSPKKPKREPMKTWFAEELDPVSRKWGSTLDQADSESTSEASTSPRQSEMLLINPFCKQSRRRQISNSVGGVLQPTTAGEMSTSSRKDEDSAVDLSKSKNFSTEKAKRSISPHKDRAKSLKDSEKNEAKKLKKPQKNGTKRSKNSSENEAKSSQTLITNAGGRSKKLRKRSRRKKTVSSKNFNSAIGNEDLLSTGENLEPGDELMRTTWNSLSSCLLSNAFRAPSQGQTNLSSGRQLSSSSTYQPTPSVRATEECAVEGSSSLRCGSKTVKAIRPDPRSVTEGKKFKSPSSSANESSDLPEANQKGEVEALQQSNKMHSLVKKINTPFGVLKMFPCSCGLKSSIIRKELVLLGIEPPLQDLSGSKELNLLSGFCGSSCLRSSRFSKLPLETDEFEVLKPVCPVCIKNGLSIRVEINFSFKAKFEIPGGEIIDVIYSGGFGAKFLECSREEYTTTDLRDAALKRLTAFINAKKPIPCTIIMVENSAGCHFRGI